MRGIQAVALSLLGVGAIFSHLVLGASTGSLTLLLATAAGTGFWLGRGRVGRSPTAGAVQDDSESAYVRLLEYAAVAANEATTLDEAMQQAVKRICDATGWPMGRVYTVELEGTLQPTGVYFVANDEQLMPLRNETFDTPFPSRESLPERSLSSGHPEGLYDLAAHHSVSTGRLADRLDLQTAFAVPISTHGRVGAVLEFGIRERMNSAPRLLELLELVGIQISRVAERAAVQQRFRQAQKLEAIGTLSAGVAHEINNPMAFARSNLNQLSQLWQKLRTELEQLDDEVAIANSLEEFDELIEESLEGIERTVSIVKDMKSFSHVGTDSRELADLKDIVASAVRVASAHAPSGVVVRSRQEGDLPLVSCSASQLIQVLVNLIVNAIEATSPSGWVDVVTCCDRDRLVIQVEDTGPGMGPETSERIFDPFFTTKPVGEGTGLGLAISHEIVRSHGGELRVITAEGAGTVMEVSLPLPG